MSNWHTVQVMGWRVCAEDGNTADDMEDSFRENEFDLACKELERLRIENAGREFYLVAEIDA